MPNLWIDGQASRTRIQPMAPMRTTTPAAHSAVNP